MKNTATAMAERFLRDLPVVLEHSRRVAARLTTDLEVSVALLHDVLEDTDADPELLRAALGDEAARSLDLLTRRETETYADYIERLATSGDDTAVRVKLADLDDHFALADTLPDSLRKRYERARDRLTRDA